VLKPEYDWWKAVDYIPLKGENQHLHICEQDSGGRVSMKHEKRIE